MPSDEEFLLQSLREAASLLDPVPPEVITAALGAFAWRNFDAELALLAYDSFENRPEMALRSGQSSPRLLTFEGSTLTVDLESISSRNERRLVGQLIPEQSAQLEIWHRGGRSTVEVDKHGRFVFSGVSAGPVSFVVRTGSEKEGLALKTDWVIL